MISFHIIQLLHRFGVKKNWNTLQVFVLHLAICDLLYCSIPLPFYSSLYIGGQWYFGEMWCKLTSILAHVFAYNSWMALALIAFSRALALPDTDVWKRLCDNGGSKKIIFLSWIVNLLILLPSLLEVSIWIKSIQSPGNKHFQIDFYNKDDFSFYDQI